MAPPPLQLINVSSPVKRPVPPPEILWPTAIGYGNVPGSTDLTIFPQWQAIKARKGARPAEPLMAFVEAASGAQDRILVMDDYLFKEDVGSFQSRIDQVLDWLPLTLAANDVRLLTNSNGTVASRHDIGKQLEERATNINNFSRYRQGRLVVEVRFTLGTLFPYVHDRFAIIDDELWHFGATVGGLHNDLNAATRGWNVDDHDALRFFEIAWKGEANGAQGGKHA